MADQKIMKQAMNITVVTGNPHKFAEMQAILGTKLSRVDLDLPEIQSLDISEVTKAKAVAAFEKIKGPVIVEDVSINITALKGLPGPLIKWFNQTIGPAGLAEIIKDKEDNSATVIELVDLFDGKEHYLFAGKVTGTIAPEPRGQSGFGFDPIFIPDGFVQTYGEMSTEQKNRISHRAIALNKLKEFLPTYQK